MEVLKITHVTFRK